MKNFSEGILNGFERITTNPSDLSDEELTGVRERIANGTATQQDRLYEAEANRRAGVDSESNDLVKETFTKLSSFEIQRLEEVFGEGEDNFIEKLKKPGGKGAGKVDLFKSDKTGDIFTKPKKFPNAEGDFTGFNVEELN